MFTAAMTYSRIGAARITQFNKWLMMQQETKRNKKLLKTLLNKLFYNLVTTPAAFYLPAIVLRLCFLAPLR